MKSKILGLTLVLLTVITVGLLSRETQKVQLIQAATKAQCLGTKYRGAWFEVIVPEGYLAKPSLPSVTNDGYDSVWFINPKLGMALYLYSPQWGGKPNDVLSDTTVTNISEYLETNEDTSIHTRTLSYTDEKIGVFISKETLSYASHLTVGYLSSHTSLPEELKQIYTCFVQSIQQFTD